MAGVGWGPDAIVAADVQHAEHVEHAVEVTLVADGDWSAPELFDESFFVRAGCGGETAYGSGGHHADGVASRERLAVEGVAVRELADALADEEFLNAVGEDGLAWV